MCGQVSDREYLASKDSTAGLLAQAKLMMSRGEGEEILFRDYEGGEGAPVCARRFISLAEKGGDDDMFSSDLTNKELKARSTSFLTPCTCFLPLCTEHIGSDLVRSHWDGLNDWSWFSTSRILSGRRFMV
jgi:hypothetical protein